jgi:hypothetical protein
LESGNLLPLLSQPAGPKLFPGEFDMTNESVQDNTQARKSSPSRALNSNATKQPLSKKPGTGKLGKARARSTDKSLNISGNSGGIRRPYGRFNPVPNESRRNVCPLHANRGATSVRSMRTTSASQEKDTYTIGLHIIIIVIIGLHTKGTP